MCVSAVLSQNQSFPEYMGEGEMVREKIGWVGNLQLVTIWNMKCNSWLIEKDPDAGKDWGQEKVTTEDEMVGWHHWLNEHEFELIPRDSKGLGSLEWCSPWGLKESDMSEQLNNNKNRILTVWYAYLPWKERKSPQKSWDFIVGSGTRFFCMAFSLCLSFTLSGCKFSLNKWTFGIH